MQNTHNLSQILPIPYQDPLEYLLRIPNLQNSVFFDSAAKDQKLGRYSTIAIDPFDVLIYDGDDALINDNGDIFNVLEEKMSIYALVTEKDLPPFQGGAAGFFSYDLGRDLEVLPSQAVDDQGYPYLALGFYDLVVSFDHLKKKAWIISSGFPELDPLLRSQRAQSRVDWCYDLLINKEKRPVRAGALVQPTDVTSNFTAENYQNSVQQLIDYIAEGDVFEANLSQRFQCRLPDWAEPIDLYCRLRALNPAPFSSYVGLADTFILSSSPERFIQLQQGRVEARPIKGTIKRSSDTLEDQELKKQLLGSEKDHAENTMIVDLMRNDLSKVCEPGSLSVPVHCGLESYATVHHLVSVICGKLEKQRTAVDLLKATFPGGSITGAPKIRAMEIIDALEPTRRGPYCGSVGYIGFDGNMDTSILIRTFVVKEKKVTFQAGGAIVLESNPRSEYEETLLKASALKSALYCEYAVEDTIKHDLTD